MLPMKLILSPILIVKLMTLAELFSAICSDHDSLIDERHGASQPIESMQLNSGGFSWVMGEKDFLLLVDVEKM